MQNATSIEADVHDRLAALPHVNSVSVQLNGTILDVYVEMSKFDRGTRHNVYDLELALAAQYPNNRIDVCLIDKSPEHQMQLPLTDENWSEAIRYSALGSPAPTIKNFVLRGALEAIFIVFLFYSNLLMGEYERSGMGRSKGFAWALRDIFTTENFVIAVAAAFIGWIVVELLRKKL